MRPRSLDELVGQEHLLGEGSTLRTAIETGEPHSAILYGPPGTGQDDAGADRRRRRPRGVRGGVGGQRRPGRGAGGDRARARSAAAAPAQPTIFFLDEIHRFNKAQQDALLPAVEEGLVTLIGATTENPYFEVNSALLSRSQIYELRALEPRADARRCSTARSPIPSAGSPTRPTVSDEALELLAERSGGDARTALGGARARGRDGARRAAARSTSRRPRTRCSARRSPSTSDGDHHYDYISAWIKATRGSDPDASLYYLAAMLEGGEDPRFIARRMVILASEDIGNADPQALRRRDRRRPGRRPGRPARVRAQPRPGGGLPGAGAEVERLVRRRSRGPRPRPRARREAAARLPARRALPGREEARPRRGLRLPARRARRRRRPAAAAGGGPGRALLRADRPRLRGRARASGWPRPAAGGAAEAAK